MQYKTLPDPQIWQCFFLYGYVPKSIRFTLVNKKAKQIGSRKIVVGTSAQAAQLHVFALFSHTPPPPTNIPIVFLLEDKCQ
jgi:hypothetical protein